jgi:hypothetical protein
MQAIAAKLSGYAGPILLHFGEKSLKTVLIRRLQNQGGFLPRDKHVTSAFA